MRGFAGVLWSCGLVAVAALIGGCGTVAADPVPASPSLPVFPATLNPDGTVPWVNAPAIHPAHRPPPTPPAIGPTCTAGQLRGVLPAWVSGAQSNDGGMAPLAAASLHGWVDLTNISASACTLDGAPAVTLMSRGNAVNVSYGQSSANAAEVGLPPHGTANFSINWAAPYCPGGGPPFAGPPDRGPFSMRATVDGVTLRVAVHSTASPGCVDAPDGETSTIATFAIEPGSVIPGAPPPGESSPLRLLRASAHDYPSHIAPGQVLKFVIALANPTSRPVSLAGTPPPAYSVGAFCLGTLTRPALTAGGEYSLDNRPRPVIRPHGSVRFAMELAIPARGCGTTALTVTWDFPAFIPQGTYADFTTTLTG